MRLVTSEKELKMVAAMQAARTAPGNQLAAGMAGSGSAPMDFGRLIAAAAPMAGGGGRAVPAMSVGRPRPSAPLEDASAPAAAPEEDDWDWGGAGGGAVTYGATGAAIGTKILPGWGTAVGGAVGVVAGGVAGGLGYV